MTPARPRSEKSRPLIFWVLTLIVAPLARFRIVDGHKLPRHGAFIVSPNHYSEIDPVMVGLVLWKLGRLPRFLAKESLFRVPVLGCFLRKSGQIPVARGGSGRGFAPLDAAQRIVEDGRVVVIYPEGSLTRDPGMWPMRGKTGAARMALEHGIPVVPIAHWGAQQVMARYAKKISVFPRKTIAVKVGDPVDLSAFTGRSLDAATLNEVTDVIMAAITALLADLRGEKAPETRWDPSQHNQKETGRFDG
ncbi:acyl-phosphate glycerol 3-phosphate acyltransferase [Leifsonia xyli subsp. xyli]|nr:lysophospholipid acyltransferase family protein [Leifsonia xyli]ODA90201.1 acyl-phosphate glycerol 3-phosphate acyltransferase [Leifsonia xyli subsp. xyli]